MAIYFLSRGVDVRIRVANSLYRVTHTQYLGARDRQWRGVYYLGGDEAAASYITEARDNAPA